MPTTALRHGRTAPPELVPARSGAEAVTLMRDRLAAPLAGATWVMRAPLRGEPLVGTYVALSGIAELGGISRMGAGTWRIGACVTHHALGEALAHEPGLAGLRDAARGSANPSVRRMATVGGAIGARGFRASDLLPALLALDAEVELLDLDGDPRTVPLKDHLAEVSQALVIAVRVVAPVASAHRRLCLRRGGGGYPVAIVSAVRNRAGEPCLAVGSVSEAPRRWHSLEAALANRERVGSAEAGALARSMLDDVEPTDGVEAPAWYRAHVLPGLVADALGSGL